MNDLTSTLIGIESGISFNESLKQSKTFNFEDGTTQSIGYKSVPSITADITYTNISYDQFIAIETAFQNNHSNTFLVDLGSSKDARILSSRLNNGVWVFADWRFSITSQQKNRYSGKITLVTSVIFNYTQFQDFYNEPSSYTPNVSYNEDFTNILSNINPYKVDYSYQLNKKLSNVGASISTQKDLSNNKRRWTLYFLCRSDDWLSLITFFRQKGSIGLFGMPVDGFYIDINQQKILARFENDSFSHSQQIGGIYNISFSIIEVK